LRKTLDKVSSNLNNKRHKKPNEGENYYEKNHFFIGMDNFGSIVHLNWSTGEIYRLLDE